MSPSNITEKWPDFFEKHLQQKGAGFHSSDESHVHVICAAAILSPIRSLSLWSPNKETRLLGLAKNPRRLKHPASLAGF